MTATSNFPFLLRAVDLIPASASAETAQNAEPSIGVDSIDPAQIWAASFGAPNPFFVSNDGGATWSIVGAFSHSDTTIAWKVDGSAVLVTTLGGTPRTRARARLLLLSRRLRASGLRSISGSVRRRASTTTSPGSEPALTTTFTSRSTTLTTLALGMGGQRLFSSPPMAETTIRPSRSTARGHLRVRTRHPSVWRSMVTLFIRLSSVGTAWSTAMRTEHVTTHRLW